MKAIILLILFFSSINVHSQSLTFSKLVKLVNIESASGSYIKEVQTIVGPFQIVFEAPPDTRIERAFTILNPSQSNAKKRNWFLLLADSGYVTSNNVVYRKSYYYETKNRENLMVLVAKNYSKFVIFKGDTVLEYSDEYRKFSNVLEEYYGEYTCTIHEYELVNNNYVRRSSKNGQIIMKNDFIWFKNSDDKNYKYRGLLDEILDDQEKQVVYKTEYGDVVIDNNFSKIVFYDTDRERYYVYVVDKRL